MKCTLIWVNYYVDKIMKWRARNEFIIHVVCINCAHSTSSAKFCWSLETAGSDIQNLIDECPVSALLRSENHGQFNGQRSWGPLEGRHELLAGFPCSTSYGCDTRCSKLPPRPHQIHCRLPSDLFYRIC